MQLHHVAGGDVRERHVPHRRADLPPELRLVVLPGPLVLPGIGEVFLIGKFAQSGHAPPPVPFVRRVQIAGEQVLVFVDQLAGLRQAQAGVLSQLQHPFDLT